MIIPLENVVQQQHARFQAKKVPIYHISEILVGSTYFKALLLLDRYDEYQKGTNRTLTMQSPIHMGTVLSLSRLDQEIF